MRKQASMVFVYEINKSVCERVPKKSLKEQGGVFLEQERDALSVVCPSDALCDDCAHVHDLALALRGPVLL